MLDLITFLIGNPWIILLVAIILLIIEIIAIVNYRQKDCKLGLELTNFLEQNQQSKVIQASVCEQKQQGLFSYLIRHLDGEIIGNEFQPRKENNYFVLFSYPSILTKAVARSPVYFAPTLLTALGILGTFFGIFFGLQKVGIGNIQETQDLLEASTTLLSGMKTAFSTSLAGLGCASLMMIVLAVGRKLRQDKRNGIRKSLSQIAFVESPQTLLSRFDTSAIANAGIAMENVAQHLSSVTNSLTAISQLTPDNIAHSIQKTIDSDDSLVIQQLKSQTNHLANLTPSSIVSYFNPLLTPIHTELTNLKKIQSLQQSNLELQIKQLTTELLTPVIARLDETTQVTNQASTAVTELKQELGSISHNLADAVTTINQFQNDTLDKLQNFSTTITSNLNQFNQDTKQVLTTVSVEMKQAVSDSVVAIQTQREAFKDSVNETATTFRQIREDLQLALTSQATQQKQMLVSVENATSKTLTTAQKTFQQQGESINKATNESIKAMAIQSEAFEKSANQAETTFNNITTQLQLALDTQATQQKQMLEGVKTSTESILEKANQAFRQQTDTIQEVGKQASKLMNQSKENLLETLLNVDDILDKTRIDLQDELETFRLEYQSSLTQFFSEQNNLLDETLGKQKEGLSLVIDQLQTTFKQEVTARAKLTDEVNQNLAKIKKTTTIISELVEKTGMNSNDRFEQLQQLSNSTANQAEKVTQAYEKMSNSYDHSLDMMSDRFDRQTRQMNDYFESMLKQIISEFNQLSIQTNNQISNHLTTANESYNKNFAQADSAMADICNQLNKTSDGLMNVAEYLVTSVNDLKIDKYDE